MHGKGRQARNLAWVEVWPSMGWSMELCTTNQPARRAHTAVSRLHKVPGHAALSCVHIHICTMLTPLHWLPCCRHGADEAKMTALFQFCAIPLVAQVKTFGHGYAYARPPSWWSKPGSNSSVSLVLSLWLGCGACGCVVIPHFFGQ